MATATKTEDILSIQRELTTVRGNIEQAKGRMLYLERTTSTSLITIKLSEAMVDIKFSADKVRLNSNEAVNFTSQISGGFAPYNYQWDFGDGDTSIEKSPRHSYKKPGSYSVSLKVTDDKNYTNTLRREGYINVIGGWSPGSIARSALERIYSLWSCIFRDFNLGGYFQPGLDCNRRSNLVDQLPGEEKDSG